MEKEELSWADLKNMFAETDRKFAESRLLIDKISLEARQISLEAKQRGEELDRRIDKIGTKLEGTNSRVDGIGNSNGKFAEEYFFNSLEEKKEFAGVHFDYVSDRFKGLVKMPDGNRLQDQFDIVMINDDAVAIIEVKYKAKSDYLEELALRKVNNFRILFPHYKDYDIYLGLGSFSFEKGVVEKAKEYGVGLLRQVGNVIEYKTDWEVKAY
jgi:hypothetical protein